MKEKGSDKDRNGKGRGQETPLALLPALGDRLRPLWEALIAPLLPPPTPCPVRVRSGRGSR